MHHIYRGLLGTVGTVAREEGASALWKGLEPGTISFAAPKTCAAYNAACLHVSHAVYQKQSSCIQDYTGNACLVGYELACMSL